MGTKGTWWRDHDKNTYDRNFPFPSPPFKREVREVVDEVAGLNVSESKTMSIGELALMESILSRHFGIHLDLTLYQEPDTIYQQCWDGVRSK